MPQMNLFSSILWPRGLCFANSSLFTLSRGRPRGAGGPDPEIDDKAGTISEISLDDGTVALQFPPTDPPFKLWSKELPKERDIETDRPYAGLVWHGASQNFFICGFSGIDKPNESTAFRKNTTDAILRFDTRTGDWHEVERHLGSSVPGSIRRSLAPFISNEYYPSSQSDLPAGWLNGPDGLLVHDNDLYAVGKDNHSIVKYNLSPIVEYPDYGQLESVCLRKDNQVVVVEEQNKELFSGPSCLATDSISLFVGLRTTNVVLAFPINGPFDNAKLIARLPSGVELIDMILGESGELYISSKRNKIWNIGIPNLETTYEATQENVYAELPGNCSNIALDSNNRLYVCCNKDSGSIFRSATPVT